MNILTKTAADLRKLHIGRIEVNSGDLLATLRYKPEGESKEDTDRYGYTEVEVRASEELHNLLERKKTSKDDFSSLTHLPATKTSSISHRLKAYLTEDKRRE